MGRACDILREEEPQVFGLFDSRAHTYVNL